jgi:hypothetical protein
MAREVQTWGGDGTSQSVEPCLGTGNLEAVLGVRNQHSNGVGKRQKGSTAAPRPSVPHGALPLPALPAGFLPELHVKNSTAETKHNKAQPQKLTVDLK